MSTRNLNRIRDRLETFRCIMAHPATIACLGLFWLGVASSTNSAFRDEGLWGYIARVWIHYGAPPYVGSVENKTPGIFLLFALSDLLFGIQYWFPRFVGFFCVAGTTWLVYRLCTFWRAPLAGVIALIVFLYPSAWWDFDGSHTTTETFMSFFSILAFYKAITSPPEDWDRPELPVMVGFFLGLAIAFKQIAIVDIPVLGYFLVSLQRMRTSFAWRRLVWFGTGIFLATVLCLIPLWTSGVTTWDYIEGAWLILRKHGVFVINAKNGIGHDWGNYASWEDRIIKFKGIALKRPDTTASVVGLLYLWNVRKTLMLKNLPALGLFLWLAFDVLGVHSAGNYFPHHFKQLLPPLALTVGFMGQDLLNKLTLLWPKGKEAYRVAVPWILIVWLIHTPRMPSVHQAWDGLMHANPAPEEWLGLWLREHARSSDYLYVVGPWGDIIQYYSTLRSSSKYFNEFFIDARTVPDLDLDISVRRPATFIILWDNIHPPWLDTIISEKYAYRFSWARYWVYDRRRLEDLAGRAKLESL